MMKKVKLLLCGLVLLILCVVAVVFALKGHKGESLAIGRDTVKQWNSGKYQILRSSTMYSFISADSSLALYRVSRYYDDGVGGLYLIGNDGRGAYVDLDTNEFETHDTMEEFTSDKYSVFCKQEQFTQLPEIKTKRSIWDIIMGRQ